MFFENNPPDSAPPDGFLVNAVVSDIVLGQPMQLNTGFVFDRPNGALVFVLDVPHEYSSEEESATGTITFTANPCDGDAEVSFSIDASLGDENNDNDTLRVQGSFTAPLNEPAG